MIKHIRKFLTNDAHPAPAVQARPSTSVVNSALPQVKYETAAPFSRTGCYKPAEHGLDIYGAVLIGSGTLAAAISAPQILPEILAILNRLESDDYVRYTMGYYQAGLEHLGEHWRYADITTALLGLGRLLQPEAYLEIGVRRGRSMVMVAAACPNCHIVGFDLWIENYAGMPNPGAEFVRQELAKVDYQGQLELISGNSHNTVKQYFQSHPDIYFDLITVDGDHSLQGAAEDLADVLPRLKIGGAIVFDDIVHPQHRYLYQVWQHFTGDSERFTTWEFDELGYGIAVAIRKK